MNNDEVKTVSAKDTYQVNESNLIPIDLVFSGSGARVPSHAGALVGILESKKFNIMRIAGTSGGAIIAALAAEHLGTPARLAVLAENLSIKTDFESLIKSNKASAFFRFLKYLGLYNGNKLEQWFKDNISTKQLRQYQNLRITTSDIYEKKSMVMSASTAPTMPIYTALRRSMSMPFVFTPKYRTINQIHRCFVDGGVTNNYPIDIFDDDKRMTLGIRLIGANKGEDKKKNLGLVKYSLAIVDTMMNAIEKEHVEDAHWANTISICTGRIKSTDFSLSIGDRRWLFDTGRNITRRWIEDHYPDAPAKKTEEE